jgi:hypothetical protein
MGRRQVRQAWLKNRFSRSGQAGTAHARASHGDAQKRHRYCDAQGDRQIAQPVAALRGPVPTPPGKTGDVMIIVIHDKLPIRGKTRCEEYSMTKIGGASGTMLKGT